jgi:pimeloyl-ACP methyl ester carboxylesterase
MVRAPVLILWGDQDSLFDAASQEQVRAAFPGAAYDVYAGFGHNVFWETPAPVATRIGAFLAAP